MTDYFSLPIWTCMRLRKLGSALTRLSLTYDQAREKFLSLRKGTRSDVAGALEQELHTSRSMFEQARFNLVTTLSNVEAKKRFEFLEAARGTTDAHLRYFKQGYELLHQMEPYINQVLTYAQQSRERSKTMNKQHLMKRCGSTKDRLIEKAGLVQMDPQMEMAYKPLVEALTKCSTP